MTPPHSLESLRAAALALHRHDHIAEAHAAYAALLRDHPGDGETCHYLAVLFAQTDRPAQSLEYSRRALDCGYETAAVHFNMAQALAKHNDGLGAAAAAAKAIELQSDDHELLTDLTPLLRAGGRERELLDALLRHADDRTSDHHYWADVASLATEFGMLDLAASSFKRAAELQPNDPRTWFNLAYFWQMAGQSEKAEQAVRVGLSHDAGFPPLLFLLSQLRPIDMEEPAYQRILGALETSSGSRSAQLQFAAATLFDRQDQVEQAFRHYDAGNRLVRSSFRYDPAQAEAEIESLARMVRDRMFDEHSGEPVIEDEPTPVFIVGLPRSGSTLLEQMLGSHSRVAAAGEIVWLQRFVRLLLREKGLTFPAGLARLDDTAAASIRVNYLRILRSRAGGASHVVDKLPANLLNAPLILELFPAARILVSVRDPLENCWSCYKHLFAGPQHFAYDLAELGRYNNACRDLIEVYAGAFPERLRIVHHEQLLAAPKAEIAQVLEFCGLGWESRCLDFHRGGELVRTASALQVRRPVQPFPRRDANRYRRFLDPLAATLALRNDSRPEHPSSGAEW